tara:strand:+ start:339 stop:992 length:654 start_codon:yes stop_codon:yes gene_type:complete
MNNKIKKSPLKFGWVTAALAVAGYLSSKKQERRARREKEAAQEEFDIRLKDYENSKFQPIDPSIVDQENIFEDMEIETSGFEIQRKAFLQQQANILQSLQSVSGSSGAAGLATALSTASDTQTQQMGMSVTQMLNRAKELRYQEEARIGAAVTNVKLANAEGARQFEIDKLNTLLGVAGQKVAGARGATGQLVAGLGQAAGSYFGAGGKMDLSKPFG